MDGFFGEIIASYTRAQAIEDGVLVDVSEVAKEAGFVWPVAVTEALWNLIEDISPELSCEDVQGRLWDVLWMASVACLLSTIADRQAARSHHNLGKDVVHYQLLLNRAERWLKAVVRPGDNGEPVVTLMLPDED